MDQRPGPVTIYTKDPVNAVLQNSVTQAEVRIATCNESDLEAIDEVKGKLKPTVIETTPPDIYNPWPEYQNPINADPEVAERFCGQADRDEVIEQFTDDISKDRSLHE